MNETEAEVYRAHREAQNKYTYFLLFAAGAAIALCVNQTHGSTLSWSEVPLAAAGLCWGLSFFFGCRHLAYVQSTLYANLVLIEVQDGRHPEAGNNPDMIAAASQGIERAINRNSGRANRYGHWQFRFLVAGAVLYVAWHILEMYLNTV